LLPKKDESGEPLFSSVFEEWFIKAYFLSFDTKREDEYFAGLINLLKSYCANIKELVENIIFHTEDSQGIIYFNFQKKEDLSVRQKEIIDEIDKYESSDRFVEIGIMDFNTKGIVDKYKEENKNEESVELIDFFDTKKIHTKEFDHLYLRYAAHLGIKTFANSIRNHKGSFYIESNNRGKKEAIEYYSGKPLKASKDIPFFCDGTHYSIIFPVKIKNENYTIYKTDPAFLQKISFLDKLKIYLDKEQLTNIIIDLNSISGMEKIDIISRQEQTVMIDKIGEQLFGFRKNNR